MKQKFKLTLFVSILFFALQVTFAQEKQITGTVTSAVDASPIPGVNVVIKGTNKGVQTDFDGKYSINTSVGDILNFSFVGMTTRTITVGNSKIVDVIMEEDAEMLGEVIVTALGIKKSRKSLTYSAQDLKAEELTRVKDANPINSLSGKISGVTINRSASGTGGSVKVLIRGNSSTSNNQPLYVIDGIPVFNQSSAQGNSIFGSNMSGNRDGGDAVSLLNPDDIESMTVLKGASASALYGSQGSNGVILITTKKGKSGKSVVRISSSTTMDNVTSLPEFQTSYKALAGGEKSWGANEPFDDHVGGFFKTGLTNINSVAFSSGNEQAQTYLSYANTNSSGVMPTNTLTKHNFNIRETAKFFNGKFTTDASVTVTEQNIHNKPTSGLYYNALTGLYLFPRGNDFDSYRDNFEVFDADRNLMAQNWLTDSHIEQNPYWILNRNATDDHNQRVLTSANFAYQFSDNLRVQSHFSYDKQNNGFEKKVYATTQGTLSHKNGRYININSTNTQFYADLLATYTKQVNEDLEMVANMGSSITNSRIGDQTTLDSGVAPGLGKANWFTIANFNGVNGITQTLDSHKELQSLYGSLHFGYKDMLFADVTARNDWSSSLVNTDNTSFFYPSFGVTGILNKLFELPESINFAKIRASYSIVGNDINSFITSPRNTITAGNVSGPAVGPRPGESLKPENQKEFETGLEMRFLDGRVGFDLTYYNSNTENQLILISAPDTNPFGYKYYAINAASISNKGVEFSVFAKPIASDNMNLKTTFNFASNKNNVSGIPDDLNGRVFLTRLTANTYKYLLENGKPYGVIESIKLVRDANGNIELDDDGKLQKGDYEDVGNANPDFTLGMQNSFNYKNFVFDFHIDGRFGGEVMSVTEAMLDGWGVSARTGAARDAGGVDIDGLSDFDTEVYYTTIGDRAGALGEYIYDATNISLREVSLGYKFKLSDTSFLKNAQFSLIGRNLFFFYKKAPYDPNISLSTGNGLQGIDVFALPTTKSFGASLNLTF